MLYFLIAVPIPVVDLGGPDGHYGEHTSHTLYNSDTFGYLSRRVRKQLQAGIALMPQWTVCPTQ